MSAIPARFRSSPDALATRVGDEIVLVDLKTDQIYSLNRTAARIWELLCADCDRAEVERRMLEEFDVTPAELARGDRRARRVDDRRAACSCGSA